jgi:hypothetical protein
MVSGRGIPEISQNKSSSKDAPSCVEGVNGKANSVVWQSTVLFVDG